MRAKVLISVFVAFCMFFAIGAVKDAKADQIIFPWIVKSEEVSTIVSVVNTAGVQHAYSFLGLDWQLHYQYWYKVTTNNLQTEICTNQSFKRPTSKDDIVTFDAAGNINAGRALFNDLSPYGGQSFALQAAAPRRAFLIVDNDTPLMTAAGVNQDGSLYGEAIVIELEGGAAWGYIAFNPSGGVNSAQTGAVRSADGTDPLGEVLGGNGEGVEATEPNLVLGTGDVTPVVLMPAHVGKTKFFMTPMDNSGCPPESGIPQGTCDNDTYNQRVGNANARITFVYHDYVVDEFYGGMFDNNENPIDFSVKKNIVCTSADNLEDMIGEAVWTVFAATGGQGWTMVDILTGTIDQTPFNLRFDNPTDDMIVGKLEFTTGGVVIDGYPIPGTFNNFNWLRNSRDPRGCVGINCVLNFGIGPLD